PSRSVCLHHQSVSSDCGTHLDLHSFPTRRSSDLKGLVDLGYEVLSTGGTLRAIAEANIPVTAVDEITGFPEILDGRVKTLHPNIDRKSTRLNSSHVSISYAVFCLKNKNQQQDRLR